MNKDPEPVKLTPEEKEDERAQWSTHDSLLQAYRQNRIASQSFLMAVAAILLKEVPLLACIVCVIGVLQLVFWYFIISARAITSDFHKYNFLHNLCVNVDNDGDLRITSKPFDPLKEYTFVHNPMIRENALNYVFARTNNEKLKHVNRETRRWLDIWFPITFATIWFMLINFITWKYLILFLRYLCRCPH